MSKLPAALLAALVLSISCNIWLFYRYQGDQQPRYFKGDQVFVDRAIAIWAKHTNSSPDHAMKSRYAQAVYAGKQICVGLILKEGSVGGNPAYCFSTENGRLVERYDREE